MKAAGIIPAPRAIVQQVVVALVVTVALAWIVGHTPSLKAWLASENGS